MDGRRRCGIDRKGELRREAHAAHDTQGVLVEAPKRLADAADEPASHVGYAVEGVHEATRRVPSHGIDCEVAPCQVFFDVLHETHRIGPAVVGIGSVGAIRGDLDGVAVDENGDGAMGRARLNHPVAGFKKMLACVIPECVGGDVDVMAGTAQDGIAHETAHHVGLLARVLQDLDGLFRTGRQRFRQPILTCHHHVAPFQL